MPIASVTKRHGLPCNNEINFSRSVTLISSVIRIRSPC
ncbi:Uncharacterised protein [Vibrio cholerae]|nr:Uncharacterised protein [Vibrio cholerae]